MDQTMNDISRKYRPMYAWTVVGLSALTYILSNIDRQIIAALVAPIERDLSLTDTQFGALTGLAYSLFYAALCIPIAALSDRFSRSMIISSGLAVWSAATAACGLATSFAQLFVARALVGIHESALLPAVFSLVGDLFPRGKLGRAMGVFFLAPFLGSTAAFLLGGAVFHWLGENGSYELFGRQFHTWQLIFMLAAAPGFLLALVIAAIVRDPRSKSAKATKLALPPFREVLHYLQGQRGIFLPFMIGFPLLAQPLYVTLAWASAYLIRTQGFSSARAGLWLGSTSLVAGCGGALIAGFLVDALAARRHAAAPFDVGIVAALFMALIMAVALLVPFNDAPFLVVAGAIFFACFSLAPSAAVIQSVAPSQYRSRISALFLVINLLVFTAFSFLIGVMNDRVFGGPKGIKFSLPLFILCSAVGSAFVLLRGRKALAGYHSPVDVAAAVVNHTAEMSRSRN